MTTFTPPGLAAFQAQQNAVQSQSVSQSQDSFGFGDFFAGALETATAFGTSLLQLELFEEQLETQAQINNLAAQQAANQAGSGTVAQGGAGSAGGGLTAMLSDPQTLMIIAVIVVVILLFFSRSGRK